MTDHKDYQFDVECDIILNIAYVTKQHQNNENWSTKGAFNIVNKDPMNSFKDDAYGYSRLNVYALPFNNIRVNYPTLSYSNPVQTDVCTKALLNPHAVPFIYDPSGVSVSVSCNSQYPHMTSLLGRVCLVSVCFTLLIISAFLLHYIAENAIVTHVGNDSAYLSIIGPNNAKTSLWDTKLNDCNISNFSNDTFENSFTVQSPCVCNLSTHEISDVSDISDSDNDNTPYAILRNLRVKNVDKIIIGHLNINSIRNKFESLADLITDRVDIILISETKLDYTFPNPQFIIPGYSPPFRLDRNRNGGGLLLFIRVDIPCKSLPLVFDGIECIASEITISKKKWFILGSYNPAKTMILDHLSTLGKNLAHYLPSYENVIIFGDFNSELREEAMSDFCSLFNLKPLIKEPTCFKNPDNPSCFDK